MSPGPGVWAVMGGEVSSWDRGWVLLRAEQPAGWACSAEGASVGFKGLIRHISVRSLPSSCFTRWNWGVWESSATSAVSSDPSLAVF